MREDPVHRDSRKITPLVAGAEVAVAAALVVGANVYDIVPISETPWLVAIGWLSLRMRGRSWKSVGLARPAGWGKTFLIAFFAAAALQIFSEFVAEPAIESLTGSRQDLSSFQDLVGNLPASLIMLVLVWTLAAFGEELAYRGYVLERAAALLGDSDRAYVAAMIAVSVLFGLGHIYQGPAGVVGSTISGLLFGGLYLACGRNLWVPILAHGISDTIGLAAIYFGYLPGSG